MNTYNNNNPARRKNIYPPPPIIRPPDPALWQNCVLDRSEECTPVFIERYTGPRQSPFWTKHDFWEMTAVFSGDGRLESDAASFILRPQTVCLTPPGIRHREQTDETMDTVWIGMRGTKPDLLAARTILTVNSEALTRQMEQVWMSGQQPAPAVGAELDAAAAGLLARFLRRASDSGADGPADHVERAIRIMVERFAEHVSIPELARTVGCSEGYFQRAFRRRTGKTPVAFLNDMRLRQACHLLTHTSLSVKEIAERTGFSSQNYLTRLFRRRLGVCPISCRQGGVT